MANKLSNLKIKRISLVKRGANNQTLQFCKSADNDSDIICYECSKAIRKDNGVPSTAMIEKMIEEIDAPWTTPKNIETIDSIMTGNDSACYRLCGIANMNLRLSTDEDPKVTYGKALLKAIDENPELLVSHHLAIDYPLNDFDYKKARVR